MKLDLNFELLNLKGEVIKGAFVGELIAQRLVSGPNGDALKLMGWGRKLAKGEAIELDASDEQTFKALVEQDQEITILTKAQVLEKMLETKEADAAKLKKVK